MEAQAGTPFFSEISSLFPDTVSASLRSACRSLAVCRHCARYLLLRYWQSPYKSVLFSEIPGYFFSGLKELFLTQPVCLQSCILFLLWFPPFPDIRWTVFPQYSPTPKAVWVHSCCLCLSHFLTTEVESFLWHVPLAPPISENQGSFPWQRNW